MNLDEITTGPLTSVSDLIDLEESFAPWAAYDLRLMWTAPTSEGMAEDRHLVIVALIGPSLHIRIFDGNGEKVFDRAENELVDGESLRALKQRMSSSSDGSSFSEQEKREIIGTAMSISGHTHRAFRGQPKTYGTLVPSFQRVFSKKKSVGAAEIIEHDLIHKFREHYARLKNRIDDMPRPYQIEEGLDLHCLSVMQHYGVPTRLLDWTGQFWTAVYFACAGNPTDDAELWYYDRAIFRPQINEGPDRVELEQPASPTPSETDVLFQRGDSRLAELDFQLTPRMREQVAHHTVCSNVFADHAPLLRSLDTQESGFRRVLIASSLKEKTLRFLEDHKNATASTIFPDVEGLGRFLQWHLETLVTTIL